MPKYTSDIVAGFVLYFTSKCVIEAMHVHASDKELSEANSAKLWVYDNGDTEVQRYGQVNELSMKKIQSYIKMNYKDMYKKWQQYSDTGFYGHIEENEDAHHTSN